MKKSLLMLMVLAAVAIPNAAFADSSDDHDKGWGNDDRRERGHDGGSKHPPGDGAGHKHSSEDIR